MKVQYSGTPVNYFDLVQAAKNAGVSEVQKQNNPGDTVGNVLGANGSIIEAVWSGVNTISLFDPSIEMPTVVRNTTGVDKIEIKSPHSNYRCILSNCNSGQLMDPIAKPNFQ